MFLGDFHIHSHYSDGQLSIEQLVDIYGKLGFGAIAITDHLCEDKTLLGKTAKFLDKTLTLSTFSEYIDEIYLQAERAKRLYNMTVIPGFEITKNSFSHKDSAHIVALGVDSFVDPNQEVIPMIEQIHHFGGLAIAAHPVSTRKVEPQTFHLWYNREELSEHLDAWEVASGSILFDEVFESGLPMLANSDLHKPHHLNSWKTLLSCQRDSQKILQAIRAQDLDFSFYSQESQYLKDIKTAMASFKLQPS